MWGSRSMRGGGSRNTRVMEPLDLSVSTTHPCVHMPQHVTTGTARRRDGVCPTNTATCSACFVRGYHAQMSEDRVLRLEDRVLRAAWTQMSEPHTPLHITHVPHATSPHSPHSPTKVNLYTDCCACGGPIGGMSPLQHQKGPMTETP